jgi:hypothetical protein
VSFAAHVLKDVGLRPTAFSDPPTVRRPPRRSCAVSAWNRRSATTAAMETNTGRSLCLVQKRALFALSLSKGHREHSILLADHPGQTPRREREILGTSHRLRILTSPVLSSDGGARRCCGTRRLCRRRPGLGDLHFQCPAVHFLAVELLDREQRKRAPETGSDEEGVHNEPTTEPDLMSLTRVRSSHCFALLRRAILESH